MRIHYTATVWHAGFYKYFADALRSLGHEVIFFNDGGAPAQNFLKKTFIRIPGFQYAVDDRFREAVSRDWMASVDAFRPNLIILQQAANIVPGAVRAAKEKKYKIFYWVDSPMGGEQARDDLLSLTYADKIFTIDRLWQTDLFRPEDFISLPLGGEPSIFHPIPDVKKEYDVSFVGSFPQATGDGALRAHILSRVPEKYRVAGFGNGLEYWIKYFPNLKHRIGGSGIQSDVAVNEIYNKSKLVVNIHSSWHLTSVSARTFEIGLAGAFQLVNWREGHDSLFLKGMLVYFHYADEVNGLIEEWLQKPKAMDESAARARGYILEHHAWKHRAEEMLSYY